MKRLLPILFLVFSVGVGAETIAFSNGNQYVGEAKNGTPHGHGTLTNVAVSKRVSEFNNRKSLQEMPVKQQTQKELKAETIEYAGSSYTGELVNGIPNGHGTYTRVDGAKYVGQFKVGKKHGQGAYTYANGSHYTGGWKDGKFHGQGTFTWADWADGEKYVGEWKDGKQWRGNVYDKEGNVTFTYLEGIEKITWEYVGEFKDGKEHGQGTFTMSDGRKYVGEWKDGKRHGQGTFTGSNGFKYVGEWMAGKYDGQGTYTYTKEVVFNRSKVVVGVKYVGEWKNSRKHGQGIYTHANGDKYVGEWKDGKHHGQGTYTRADWGDGDKYVGEWKDGKRHGQGMEITWSGPPLAWIGGSRKYVAEWKDGLMVQGTVTMGFGEYVGEFKGGGAWKGQGTFNCDDGNKVFIKWDYGEMYLQGISPEDCWRVYGIVE